MIQNHAKFQQPAMFGSRDISSFEFDDYRGFRAGANIAAWTTV